MIKIRKIVWLPTLIIGLFIVSVLFDLKKANTETKIVESTDLNLSGIVIAKKEFEVNGRGGYGYVLIDIKTSNYDNFDPRENGEDYAFLIKDNKCILMANDQFEKGDSIIINKDNYKFFRKNKLISESSFGLFSDSYYNPSFEIK
ncbi:hypothetical protein [Flavobacterium sp.]|uniref:hypothetical protein n=1 Tax=Flavobacterium sp. TaxID=239 RepID=UPI00260D3168|nr:hypothetical protein [Flavobacterium sp.]